MRIIFYKYTGENNKIDKTAGLTQLEEMRGELKAAFNDLGGTIEINKTEAPTDFNYCYIEDLKRYYFIQSITYEYNSLYVLELKEDVLYTHKDKILNENALIARAEGVYNLYTQDAERLTQQNTNTYIKEFPNSFNDVSYILTTAGSYQNIEEV